MTGANGLVGICIVVAGLCSGHGALAGAPRTNGIPSALPQIQHQQKIVKREWEARPEMVFFTASDVGFTITKPTRDTLRGNGFNDGHYQAHGSAMVGTRLRIGKRLQVAGTLTSRTQRQRDDEDLHITDRVEAAVNAAYDSPLGQFSLGYSPSTLATNADSVAPDRLTVRLSRPAWMPGRWQATDYYSWLRVDPEGLDGGYEEFSLTRQVETVLKTTPHGARWTMAIEPAVRVRQFALSPIALDEERRDITASLAATWRHAITAATAFTARLNVEKVYSTLNSVDQAQAGLRLRFAARF